jgi:predicted RNA binding protein YcfA (HicA-like mRNA interferase family)
MGRLSGFSYRDVSRKLIILGFVLHRQAKGSHEIWKHSEDVRYLTLPHHQTLKEGTLKAVLKQANVSVEAFLKA